MRLNMDRSGNRRCNGYGCTCFCGRRVARWTQQAMVRRITASRQSSQRFTARLDHKSLFCCGIADTVKTKFKVEPGDERYPEDRWYAWLKDDWVRVPAEKIVTDFAPDGQAYLFSARRYNSMLHAAKGGFDGIARGPPACHDAGINLGLRGRPLAGRPDSRCLRASSGPITTSARIRTSIRNHAAVRAML